MVTRVDRAPAAPDDQAGQGVESLDAIAAMGAGLDAPPPPDLKAEAAVLASEAEEIQTALMLIRAAAVPLAADHVQDPLLQVWSDKQLREVAEALVECARASGITVTDWFKGYGHWVRLAFALGIPAMATIKLLRMPPPPRQVHQVQSDGQQQSA